MIEILKTLGAAGTMFFFLVLVIGIITIFRLIINHEGKEALEKNHEDDFRVKKYPGVDAFSYRGMIFNLGLILSLGMMIVIFEYPNFDEQKLVELEGDRLEFDEMQEVPPTEQKPPPPPKIKAPEIIEVADEVEIEEEIEIDLDMEADESTIVEEVQLVIEDEGDDDEEAEQIFEVVEDPAGPIGGYGTFYEFIGENLKYPKKALAMQVAGKVYVQFVVDKDGSLTDVKVIRGIGAGCDEEAKRILEGAPKWNPGKQRGRAVKQRIVLPINFKLG